MMTKRPQRVKGSQRTKNKRDTHLGKITIYYQDMMTTAIRTKIGMHASIFFFDFFIFIPEITTEKGLLLCVLMRCGVALRKTISGTKYITSL